MTMCPIQTSLIEPSLLTDAEITWLNAYHAEVREKLQPFIEESFPDALSYLIAETEPLSK
jgi:Xaa-Pro aminopeptidase